MKIALAQINLTVGDFINNQEKILARINSAKKERCEIIVFPELATTGYPPQDLLFREDFITANWQLAQRIIKESKGIGIVFGCVEWEKRKFSHPDRSFSPFFPGVLYNSALFAYNQKIISRIRKINLPSYDVFDEKRYFQPGNKIRVLKFIGRKIGINICEDIWVENGVLEKQKSLGAEIIINISASPFYIGKYERRKEMLREKAKKNQVYLIYCNLVGGQDDLIFDGGSFVFTPEGKLIACGKRFEEDLVIFSLEEKEKEEKEWRVEEEVVAALGLGLKDYLQKNGFKKVCLGISGGIDSAITAALAVKALGRESVLGVIMPGPYTPKSSLRDAELVVKNLGISYWEIDIREIYNSYLKTLKRFLKKEREVDTTWENIQARIRGNILMAISNKFGHLVLSTGNKSEMAVGYTTLYGDMAGGLAIIADLPKSLIYKVAHYLNETSEREVIPKRIITKPPSAELRPNQRDEDDLLPYSLLDEILRLYIEENFSPPQITKRGFKKEDVERVVRLVNKNEYKRRQAPLPLKITHKAFGFGRRMPITNKFI
ncbi:MAG: NAD+ synthase [candidate division WOR-3 bacterium]